MSYSLSGAKIGLVNAVPATLDPTGFAALTYEFGICALKSVPELPNRTWESVEDSTVCNRKKSNVKGMYSLANISYELNVEDDCPAQLIYGALEASDDIGSFVLELPSGKKHYWTAQVSKFSKTQGGDGNAIDTRSVELMPQSEIITAPAP